MSGDRFYALLAQLLAEKGVRINSQGKYERIPGYAGPNPFPRASLDYLNDAQEFQKTHSMQMVNWVSDFLRIIDRVMADDSSDPADVRALFFIRLHGIIVDLPKKYPMARETLKTQAPTPTSTLHKFSSVVDAIDQLRNALTEDEQLWAEYRRQNDCHLLQLGYEPQWDKKQSAAKAFKASSFTGKSYEIHDLDGRLAAVFSRYGTEKAIAEDFAHRLAIPAKKVFKAIGVFCSPDAPRRVRGK